MAVNAYEIRAFGTFSGALKICTMSFLILPKSDDEVSALENNGLILPIGYETGRFEEEGDDTYSVAAYSFSEFNASTKEDCDLASYFIEDMCVKC